MYSNNLSRDYMPNFFVITWHGMSEEGSHCRNRLATTFIPAEFFRMNPRDEIIQDYGAIYCAPRGTAFLKRHSWLGVIAGKKTIPQATIRSTIYILFGWLLWTIIQSVRVTRDLRRKDYTHLSITRLLLLYLSTGSALRHLPSRDEAASLPDVDVQSWRSLRRFVIAQAGRK